MDLEVAPARTVGELLRALDGLDPDLPVELEGCDCVNELSGVQLTSTSVYLRADV